MTETQRPITRIDLVKLGESRVGISVWQEGWRELDPCDGYQVVAGSIESLLFEYEKQGYAVEMCDSDNGRALRGKTTRVDFLLLAGQWHIRKFPYGWTAVTRPISDQPASPEQVEQAIGWCLEHGWTVLRWPEGARAWLGEAKPIRDARTIRSMRRRVDADFNDPRRHYDLALYW